MVERNLSSSPSKSGGGHPSTSSTTQSSLSASVSNLRDATANSAQSFITDLIQTSLPSTSVDGAKQALSLRTTTLQFTRFVHKTGPVFVVQDAIESVFRWQDPIQTVFCGAVWALICLYPQLVLLIPSMAISAILLVNHHKRFPPSKLTPDDPYQRAETVRPPPSGQPPTEGSVDYFQNLQNIQELMGRVADMTDAGRQIVPYFNWSDPQLSTVLLQLSSAAFIATSLVLLFGAKYLDMRYVFLGVGELSLLATHPFSISFAQSLLASPVTKLQQVRMKALAEQIMQDDSLPDEYIFPNKKGERRSLKEIVVYENERRGLDGSWSTDALRMEDPQAWQVLLDGKSHGGPSSSSTVPSKKTTASAETTLTSSPISTDTSAFSSTDSTNTNEAPLVRFETIRPPSGYAWVTGEEWQIDRVGYSWSLPAGVDAEGWSYADADGRPMAAGSLVASAAARKRKWYRRIVSVPTY